MMRSLNSAVAGLRTHQTKMDVIGNNIANVNTAGFKASRVTFADIYYQNVTSASSPTGARGGTNPTQIGYGSTVATIDILNTQTGGTTTDRAFDVYITGDGFLVTQDADGNYLYTRLGNLKFDAAGNIVDANGNFVLGVKELLDFNNDGTVNKDKLSRLNVPPAIASKLTQITISPSGQIFGVQPGEKVFEDIDLTAISDWLSVTSGTDDDYMGDVTLSVSYGVKGTLPTNDWMVNATTLGTDYALTLGTNGADAAITYRLNDDGKIEMLLGTTVIAEGKYAAGKTVTLEGVGTYSGAVAQIECAKTAIGDVQFTSNQSNVTVDMELQVTISGQYKSGVEAGRTFSWLTDMNPTGGVGTATACGAQISLTLADLLADANFSGGVKEQTIGRWKADDGETYEIGYLALATFPNTEGLQQAGSSNFSETNNSGEPVYARPGLEGTGSTVAGMLEMSNVDISQEFTDMITTQRGFQANSRIITVSDEMLQELVNLKR